MRRNSTVRRNLTVRRNSTARRELTPLLVLAALLSLPPGSALAEDGGPTNEQPGEDASERPVFLVTDIVVGEGVGISGEAARDALAGRFGRLRDKLDVRSLGEVKATLDQQALNQLLGEESGQLEDLGRYLDVDRVVFGRIHQVGGVTEVGVRVFNIKDGAMEMAMSRRLQAGAPGSLVLSVVDSLADRLAVWALSTYGDAAPSDQFAAMKKKKVGQGDRGGVSSKAASPWSLLGVGGSAIAGLGLGAVAVGATLVSADPLHDALVPGIIMGAGAATFLGGVGLVVFDGVE